MSSKWVGEWWKKHQKTKGVGSPCSSRRKLVEMHRLFGVDGAPWSKISLHLVFTSATTAKWGRQLGKFDVLPNNIHRHVWPLQIVKQLVREGEARALPRPRAERETAAIKLRARLVRKVLRSGGLVKVPGVETAITTSAATPLSNGVRRTKEGPWARHFIRLAEHQSKTVHWSVCRFCLAAHMDAPSTVLLPSKVAARRASQVPHLKRCMNIPPGRDRADVDELLTLYGTLSVPLAPPAQARPGASAESEATPETLQTLLAKQVSLEHENALLMQQLNGLSRELEQLREPSERDHREMLWLMFH